MIIAVADTHALVWALLGDARLSPAARTTMTVSPGGQIAVSAITLVDILYLEEKQRLPAGLLARITGELAAPGSVLVEIPSSAAVVGAMAAVSRTDVPDMPDRIIAGTAVRLRVPVISRDGKIRASSVATIW